MEMKNEKKKKVKGTVSAETAKRWKNGELKYNNGLRQAKGRGSLNPEQPNVELDSTPDFLEEITATVKSEVVVTVNNVIANVFKDRFEPVLSKLANDAIDSGRDFFVAIKDSKKVCEKLDRMIEAESEAKDFSKTNSGDQPNDEHTDSKIVKFTDKENIGVS